MAFGFLNIPFESRVLSYDDESTPTNLCGEKMLPILVWEKDQSINESIEIIKKIDLDNSLFGDVKEKDIQQHEQICNDIGKKLHPLAMTSWLNTPEFFNNSKEYFRKKKEIKKGPFNLLIKDESRLKENLGSFIKDFKFPRNFFLGDHISVLDIMAASHFYGVYSLIDFYLEKKAHDYLQRVRNKCNFNYHEDYDVNSSFEHWNK